MGPNRTLLTGRRLLSRLRSWPRMRSRSTTRSRSTRLDDGWTAAAGCLRVRTRPVVDAEAPPPRRPRAVLADEPALPLRARGRHAHGARDRSRGTATRREEDGRFAFVLVTVEGDVAFEPKPDDGTVASLLAKAERDCFIGRSLTGRLRRTRGGWREGRGRVRGRLQGSAPPKVGSPRPGSALAGPGFADEKPRACFIGASLTVAPAYAWRVA